MGLEAAAEDRDALAQPDQPVAAGGRREGASGGGAVADFDRNLGCGASEAYPAPELPGACLSALVSASRTTW